MSNLNVVCLDLEGVLVPEIWIAFAEETGIEDTLFIADSTYGDINRVIVYPRKVSGNKNGAE